MIMVPNVHYLQVYARSNNLRTNMIFDGKEVKGTSFMIEVVEMAEKL